MGIVKENSIDSLLHRYIALLGGSRILDLLPSLNGQIALSFMILYM